MHLVDLDHIVKTRHESNNRDADIVPCPPPSDHPDDLLNRSLGHKKLLTFLHGCVSLSASVISLATCDTDPMRGKGTCLSPASVHPRSTSILEPLSKNSTIKLANLNTGTRYDARDVVAVEA